MIDNASLLHEFRGEEERKYLAFKLHSVDIRWEAFDLSRKRENRVWKWSLLFC
jgi:hypothetical protein